MSVWVSFTLWGSCISYKSVTYEQKASFQKTVLQYPDFCKGSFDFPGFATHGKTVWGGGGGGEVFLSIPWSEKVYSTCVIIPYVIIQK